MDERVAQYLHVYSCLFQTTVQLTMTSHESIDERQIGHVGVGFVEIGVICFSVVLSSSCPHVDEVALIQASDHAPWLNHQDQPNQSHHHRCICNQARWNCLREKYQRDTDLKRPKALTDWLGCVYIQKCHHSTARGTDFMDKTIVIRLRFIVSHFAGVKNYPFNFFNIL